MSAPIENVSEMSGDDTQCEKELHCVVEAKVATGFEYVAKEEAVEKLKVEVSVNKGRINIHLPVKDVPKVLELEGVDNCYVQMTQVKDFPFVSDELESMKKLREFVKEVDWDLGLTVWKTVFSFKHPILSTPEVIPESLGEPTLSSRVHKPQKGDNRSTVKKKKGKKSKNRDRKDRSEVEGEKIGKTRALAHAEEKNKDNKADIKFGCNQGNNDDCTHSNNDFSDVSGKDQSITEPDVKSDIVTTSKTEDVEKRSHTGTDLDDEQKVKKQRVKLTEYDPLKPTFRVSCNRSGENHSFDSMGAASNFGGAVYGYFHWNVDMTKFDIEVVLNIEENEVRVCLALTKESLHKRNLFSFGPTTLRPTIAYNLLRLCDIKPGDIVCDPMCGSGSIPVQAGISWPGSYHIAGEIANMALHRAWENVQHVDKLQKERNKHPLKIDCIRWDVCNLPFKDESVDVITTDLPFGVRVGSKKENWNLYPGAVKEMARVCKLNTGRACLLTQDKKCITKAIQTYNRLWKVKKILGINLGGLAVSAYLLLRTSTTFSEFKSQNRPTSPPPENK